LGAAEVKAVEDWRREHLRLRDQAQALRVAKTVDVVFRHCSNP